MGEMNLIFLPFGYWVAILKFSQIRIKKKYRVRVLESGVGRKGIGLGLRQPSFYPTLELLKRRDKLCFKA